MDLSPLRESPAYLRFWISGIAGGIGVQLTAVAIGIQVYEISGSTAAVAMVGALALGPMILVGVLGGTLVDAFDRRKVLISASGVAFCAPIGIALLAWNNVETLWAYYSFTTLSSAAGALVGAARFAIHPRLVRRELLPAVAALSAVSAGLQAAGGPALAGILVASVGYAWTYTIDVALFAVGFWGIISLPPIRPQGQPRFNLGALRDGLAFLRRAQNLRTAIGLHVVAFTLGRPYAIFPAVGALLIGGGAWTVGLLTASGAIGVIASSVFSGRFGEVRRHGVAIGYSTMVYGLMVGALGLATLCLTRSDSAVSAGAADFGGLVLLCSLTALIGGADNVAGIFRTTMMQSATPDEYRGRLQGIYTLVLSAGPRLGDTYIGFVAALFTLWFPQLLGALLILFATGAYLRLRPGFRRYDGADPVP
ncbi:MFS transporter [Nesterenkonia sandarakina]|uniref:Transmembrane secretion effector n=1 Tax=Nesterenkonia sandarakina TaxID=272918 RepID=A0A2T0YN42_9MICC|nr:MFS transporter [Nesterenkonia sandarakina]PRZ16757.1 transmembrane secretion effector [Nesterenkonia sandarakina]